MVSSCMMIDAVMYGMIPRANTASALERAPGEQVEEAEHAAALVEHLLTASSVDPRHRHVASRTGRRAIMAA